MIRVKVTFARRRAVIFQKLQRSGVVCSVASKHTQITRPTSEHTTPPRYNVDASTLYRKNPLSPWVALGGLGEALNAWGPLPLGYVKVHGALPALALLGKEMGLGTKARGWHGFFRILRSDLVFGLLAKAFVATTIRGGLPGF